MSQPEDAPPKVLVVDDNEQNRALVQTTLEEEGYRVIVASSGQAGLVAFDAEAPDCALLDVRMPGMDGLSLCRAIRARPNGIDTPLVFLTALRDVETFDEALRAGADDFLTKPVRPTELLVRVQAALKLRRLTSENRGYYQTVREQRDALIRLQLQKEQLMAFVVHDLKNPVSAMDLHAQLLLRDPTLSTGGRGSVQTIREEARLLTRLIKNLLDLSKSDEGQLVPNHSAVELGSLVNELLGGFQAHARAKQVTLTVSVEAPPVRADPDLLRRVIENLIDNAIRHAPGGSVVRVTATLADEHVHLTVEDGGAGVPPDMRERIFERFVQLNKTGALRGGYGLGLAFCKQAVELHGGRIWVEDGAPGAVFCIRLGHAA